MRRQWYKQEKVEKLVGAYGPSGKIQVNFFTGLYCSNKVGWVEFSDGSIQILQDLCAWLGYIVTPLIAGAHIQNNPHFLGMHRHNGGCPMDLAIMLYI